MNFYTYIYYDPSRGNEPIYVGKGVGKRVWSHLYSKQKTPFVNRLQFMIKNGNKPTVGIYAGFDEELAHLVEMELISKFGRKDLGKGPLLNLTDGGEGQTGLIHTTETKRKMSESHLGIPRSEDTKQKISKGNKNKPKSTEHRTNLSIANTGKTREPLSEEVKRKISIANTGKVRSKDTLEKMSLAQTGSSNPNFGRPKSEESKLKSRMSNLGQKRSEETKQRMSEAQRKRFNNATQRANNE